MRYEGSDMTEHECEKILDEWLDEHPEFSEKIENTLDVIVNSVKGVPMMIKPVMFARAQAAMVLYRMIEKGYLLCK